MVISEKTEKIYIERLTKLDKMGVNTNDNLKKIMEVFKTQNLSDSSIKLYLMAILWNNKKNSINKENNNDISKMITKITKKQQKEIDKNKLSKKQEDSYLEWEEILKIYEELKKNREQSKNNYIKYVILSLYIEFPPRRILDYSEMYVIRDNYIINKNLTEEYDKKNYYVYDKNIIIFNNYKTKSIQKDGKIYYKQQHFKINNKLNNILKEYIDKYKINGSLFNISDKGLIMKLNSIFRNKNKKISVDIIRHSYITWAERNGLLDTVERKKKLSEKMAHSVLQQLSYKKIVSS